MYKLYCEDIRLTLIS